LVHGPERTAISTPSLHDALPILLPRLATRVSSPDACIPAPCAFTSAPTRKVLPPSRTSTATPWLPVAVILVPIAAATLPSSTDRSEEHTSELQSRENLVCRLLLE